MLRNLVGLGILAAGVWYVSGQGASRQSGTLPGFRGFTVPDWLPGFGRDQDGGDVLPAVTPASVPASDIDVGEVGASVHPFVALLLRNDIWIGAWARANLEWTAAIIKVESNGNPKAASYKGALGLMQVMPATARDIDRWGLVRLEPTREVLTSERGGLHYGTAYLDYLSGINSNRDWMTAAYYGGPGWDRQGPRYQADCRAYVQKVSRAFADIKKWRMA